jgi:hypothetical protein
MFELTQFRKYSDGAKHRASNRISLIGTSDQPWTPEYRALVAMIAAVEEFLVERLKTIVIGSGSGDDLIVSESLELTVAKVDSSWPARVNAVKRWFSLDLRANPDFESFEKFIQVRNAIVHGNGSLTRRQLGKDGGAGLKGRLTTIGLSHDGNRLNVTDQVIDRCVTTCVNVLHLVDRHTKSSVPR